MVVEAFGSSKKGGGVMIWTDIINGILVGPWRVLDLSKSQLKPPLHCFPRASQVRE